MSEAQGLLVFQSSSKSLNLLPELVTTLIVANKNNQTLGLKNVKEIEKEAYGKKLNNNMLSIKKYNQGVIRIKGTTWGD